MLMLDQRGTGRSTPVDATASADYLVHFRADSIVRDAELVREALGVDRWSVLGQSFGGLCVFTYLSLAPEGLREAFTTGGVPGIGTPIDDVYRATYARTVERNRRYFERFPEDRERLRDAGRAARRRGRAAADRRPADRRAACARSAASSA